MTGLFVCSFIGINIHFVFFWAKSFAFFLRPLTVPHGKALVAKELGAWTGADGYYHEDGVFEQNDEEGEEKEETDVSKAGTETKRGGREALLPPQRQHSQQQQQQQESYRRYLALDGHALSMNHRDVNHHPTYLRAMLAVMVAVAKATGRILILPAVFHDAFYVYAWNHLDLKSVSASAPSSPPCLFAKSRRFQKGYGRQLGLL